MHTALPHTIYHLIHY